MRPLSTPRLVLKRLADDWVFLTSIFVGITVAATIVAAAPIYLRALERLALNNEVDSLARPGSNLTIIAQDMPLRPEVLASTELAVSVAIDSHVAEIYERRERYISMPTYLADTPTHRLPVPGTVGARTSRAYFRNLSNIEPHLRFLAGEMAGTEVISGPDGPIIEAIVSPATARMFQLRVGSVVIVAPDLETETRIAVEISGVAEAIDPTEDFWAPHAAVFLDPPPLNRATDDASIDYDEQEPPAPLFITREALLDAVAMAYPGTLVNSFWFILVDTEGLKGWPVSEGLERLDSFERDVARAMPGADVVTTINDLLLQFEQRRFFAGAPLLLLSAVLTATVLFFLSMMISYLVQTRETEAALFKTRGVSIFQLVRLNSLEGLSMVVLGVILAPFIAIVIVALAGRLPSFNEVTGGSALPVEPGLTPFVASAAVGLLCLALYLVPALSGSRAGLLAQKMRTSRPPSMPFFHRYYLDIAVLVIGGLTFWELYQRGHIISGGLFGDVEVNETLLAAPVLFLVVVGLMFVRFFPLTARFVGGESPALLHLVTAASVLTLAVGSVADGIADESIVSGVFAAVLALAVGGLYWWTDRAPRLTLTLTGLGLQAAFVAAFLAVERLDQSTLILVPTIGLVSMVPAQIAFFLLRASSRVTPVWLSMSLWRMARNPLQYTWLILLLVLTAGLGLVSATIGTSLEENQQERINHAIASDIRVSGIPGEPSGAAEWLKEQYLGVSGVTSVSLALRENVNVGPAAVQLLGLESNEFPYLSWYREDFSTRSLDEVMRTLRSHPQAERIEVPEGAGAIGLWAKPEEEFSSLSVRVMVEDGNGSMVVLPLGQVSDSDWQIYRAPLPDGLKPPVYLVGVQFFEPVLGAVGTPGSLFLDDIHATVGPDNTEQILEDFEEFINWTPILTAPNSSDRILITTREVHDGRRAGTFSFGKEAVGGVRGFYMSPTGGPMPVVVSGAFADEFDTENGEVYIAEIGGRRLPVVVRDTVQFFPTMNSHEQLFVLADLTSLQRNLDILTFATIQGVLPRLESNELFLSGAPDATASLHGDVQALTPSPARVQDRASQLELARRDPLTTAGWNSLVILSLGLVVVAAGLGYAAYLFLFWRRSKSEMGFLQSMGLSRSQLIALLGFEHLSLVGLGLGLGIWAGMQMSNLMVSSVAATDSGEPMVPPLLLSTDWSLLAPTYVALVGTFVAALILLNRSFRRLDLHTVARVEGP